MIWHWLAHWLGLDNPSGPVYLAWSGVVGAGVLGSVAAGLRRLMKRHHVATLAQAAQHHLERQQQAADHHKGLKDQSERHHQQVLDQAEGLHQALKAHISAQTPTPAATDLPARSRKTGSGM